MKEFEKWWAEHRASVLPHTCQSSRGENLAMLADKDVWKAALEWVLGKMDKIYNGVFENSEIMDVIKKELKES